MVGVKHGSHESSAWNDLLRSAIKKTRRLPQDYIQSTWSWHSTNEDEGRLAIIFKQCSILRLQGLNSFVFYNILRVLYRRDHARLLAHALGLWTVHHCLTGCAYAIKIVKKFLSCDFVTSYPCTSGRIWAGPSLLWGGFSSNFLSTTSPC